MDVMDNEDEKLKKGSPLADEVSIFAYAVLSLSWGKIEKLGDSAFSRIGAMLGATEASACILSQYICGMSKEDAEEIIILYEKTVKTVADNLRKDMDNG